MLKTRILSALGGEKLYMDDVFQAYTRTGTGADTTITTGIDMTKGYMLWSKGRSDVTDHAIYDSARGVTLDLASNTTAAQTTQTTGLKSVSATGHTVGSLAKMNTSAATYVDFVFRNAPKFFDVVTYTGDGASSRAIAHSLGQEVGMVMTKATSTTGDWNTYHRSATGDLVLNTTAAQTGSKALVNSATTTTFTVSGAANTNGVTYVAYLLAHDPSADGIIQCGSYVGNGSATGPEIALGWEPQYVLIKPATSSGNWTIVDSIRSLSHTAGHYLVPNLAQADMSATVGTVVPNATGFKIGTDSTYLNQSDQTYIYLAIRRPNKPPKSGTEVYNAIARTGTGAAATVTGVGFAPDLVMTKSQSSATYYNRQCDRLRGNTAYLTSNELDAEISVTTGITSFNMDGVTLSTWTHYNDSSTTYINHFLRRAPGFFDVVCDTGTGAAHAISHNLGTVPELMIRKGRSGATQWEVYSAALANTEKLVLNSTAAKATDTTAWNSTTPTATQFTVGTGANVNADAATFVTYLFATLTGISKIGSYTGNGTTQTINCGFTTGARFILIKRTDSTGDWYIWDTARGIVSADDPHLSLNTTAAEVTTDDSVDPENSGFSVNQNTATDINVNAASYIFLAIA